MPLLCRLNWLLMLEVWLDTVERRVDMKLLLVERRSRLRMQSKMPRHGMYLAKANLDRDREVKRSSEALISASLVQGKSPSTKRVPDRETSQTRTSRFIIKHHFQ